jgi:hypothetical protein
MDGQYLKRKMLARERVANVRKHWVRLVTACNHRCIFARYRHAAQRVRTEDDVHRSWCAGGAAPGRQGHPLGGEGSIHRSSSTSPLRQGNRLHARANRHQRGVMFAKREFYAAAVAAAHEITFSLQPTGAARPMTGTRAPSRN